MNFRKMGCQPSLLDTDDRALGVAVSLAMFGVAVMVKGR